VEQEPQHPLEAARDDLDDALPLLTGDPMSTAASFVQQSGKRESLEEWTDDALTTSPSSESAAPQSTDIGRHSEEGSLVPRAD
jgi:hypothetical protein